jgi:hypothetical protein
MSTAWNWSRTAAPQLSEPDQYGDALAGKVIVDISDPFNDTFDGLAHREEISIAQEVARAAPADAHVVKAFNTVFRHVLEKGRPDVFLAATTRRPRGVWERSSRPSDCARWTSAD